MTPLLIAVEGAWGALFAVLASMPSPAIAGSGRRHIWAARAVLGVGAVLLMGEAAAHFVAACGGGR